jgi:hypothetical protein
VKHRFRPLTLENSEQRSIANVLIVEDCFRVDVVLAAARKVVDDDDTVARVHEGIDYVRADEACPTGN